MSRPLAILTRQSPAGIPYLATEIQLLFKAKTVPLAKDEHDFTLVFPLLDKTSRTWLATALAVSNPQHPWIERL